MPGLESPSDVSSPDRLKHDRKVFDRVHAKYKDTPVRDDFTGMDPVAASPPSNAEEPQHQQAPSAETPAGGGELTAQRKAAEEFLHLKTGSPASVFASMSDEEIALWAEDRRTREAAVDATFSRAAATERELERLRTDAAAKPAEPTGPTAAEALAEASEALSSSLTEEERAALSKLIDLQVAPLKAELAQRDKRAQQEQSQRAVRTVERVRGELAERFGQLADDTKFSAVLGDMELLESSPRFGGSGRPIEEWVPDLMTAVARSHGLTEQENEVSAARQAASDEQLDRAAGTVTTGGRNAPTTAPTKANADRAAYDAIRKKHRQKQWAVG